MTGTVSSFACGYRHPQLDMPCVRARAHAGDHRAELDGVLKVWGDAVTPYDVPQVRTLTDNDGVPLPTGTFDPRPELDETLEAWGDSEYGGVWHRVDDATQTIILTILVMLALAGPPLLVMLYRAAL